MGLDEEMKKEIERVDNLALASMREVEQAKASPRRNYLQGILQLRTVEGRVALRYWEAFKKALPEWLDFQGRMTSSHQNNASDSFNAALNYGYGSLEGECRMAINAVGLEPAIR